MARRFMPWVPDQQLVVLRTRRNIPARVRSIASVASGQSVADGVTRRIGTMVAAGKVAPPSSCRPAKQNMQYEDRAYLTRCETPFVLRPANVTGNLLARVVLSRRTKKALKGAPNPWP